MSSRSIGGASYQIAAAAALDQVGQHAAVQVDGRRRVGVGVGGRSVEADEGVEVDDAAALELRHFGELHPHPLPRRRFGQPEMGGELRGGGRW